MSNFGPYFGPSGTNLGLKNFFVGFTFIRYETLLQATIVFNFKEKSRKSPQKYFGHDLGPLGPNSGRQFCFFFNYLFLF